MTQLTVLTPHPIGRTLPGLFQDDAVAQRFCAALDEVLAPDLALLDCFPAYLSPGTAPPDMLDWLAGWVGLDAARRIPLHRRRRLVARAAHLHAWRGTPAAIRELLELATGRACELEESGGTTWSTVAGAALPGGTRPGLYLRVTGADAIDPEGSAPIDDLAPFDEGLADDPDPVDLDLLRRLLVLLVPAHIPWSLELT